MGAVDAIVTERAVALTNVEDVAAPTYRLFCELRVVDEQDTIQSPSCRAGYVCDVGDKLGFVPLCFFLFSQKCLEGGAKWGLQVSVCVHVVAVRLVVECLEEKALLSYDKCPWV